jgi:hypothetical protein
MESMRNTASFYLHKYNIVYPHRLHVLSQLGPGVTLLTCIPEAFRILAGFSYFSAVIPGKSQDTTLIRP